MNLCIPILFDELTHIYEKIDFIKGEYYTADMLYSSMSVYNKEQIQANTDILLTENLTSNDKLSLPEGALIISLSECAIDKRYSYFFVQDKTSLVSLYEETVKVFDKYTKWDESLSSALLSNAPLNTFLKLSFDIFSNPLSMHDRNNRYIARAGVDNLPESYQYINNQKFLDPTLINATGDASAVAGGSREVNQFESLILQSKHLVLNLFDANAVSGMIVLSNAYIPFREYDKYLLKHLGKYLQTALRHTGYDNENNALRSSLKSIFGGNVENPIQIKQMQKLFDEFGYTSEDIYNCVYIESLSYDFSMKYLAYEIEMMTEGAVVVMMEDSLAMILKRDNTEKSLYDILKPSLNTFSLRMGISNEFKDLTDISNYYIQAAAAVKTGKLKEKDKQIYKFKDYALDYFFMYGLTELNAKLIAEPSIVALQLHDKTSSVSYCESLRIYLDENCNSAKTAKKLFIERNTFIARLERIKKRLALDLNDPKDRLYMKISLMLISDEK